MVKKLLTFDHHTFTVISNYCICLKYEQFQLFFIAVPAVKIPVVFAVFAVPAFPIPAILVVPSVPIQVVLAITVVSAVPIPAVLASTCSSSCFSGSSSSMRFWNCKNHKNHIKPHRNCEYSQVLA